MAWGGARPNSGPKPKGDQDKAQALTPAAPAERKPPFKISDHVLLRSRQPERRPTGPLVPARGLVAANPFQPTVSLHPPTQARDGSGMAMDEAVTANAAWAYNAMNSAWVEGTTFMGYPYLAELAQRPEYRVISETIATEMTRKGIKLQAKGDDDKTQRINELDEELKRLRVLDILREVAEQDGFFGRAHIYVDTGQTDNPEELRTPIGDGWNDISKMKVGKGSLQRLAAVEAVWASPDAYNSSDPLRRDWYRPDSWIVQSKRLHASRLLTFIGREVPDLLKPAYSFGGVSLSQMAKPYVDNWLRTRQSVADLIHAFSVFVLSTNLSATLQVGGDGDLLFRRLQLFTNFRDNRGLMVTDKDTEELDNVSAPLGTLDALQAQTQEHMASVSRIPLVKLLGIQPAGLNASSEGEIRTFYDTINAYQWKFFAQNLHRIIGFAMLNLWGEVDPDIVFDFESLWALDEKAEAEVRKMDAETGAILINDGALDREEERKRVAEAPDTPYHGLDINDLPEEPEPPGGGGDPFGGGGGADPGGEDPGGGAPKDQGAADAAPYPFVFDEWREADHPRGQPENAGQFGSGGSGSGGDPAPAKSAPSGTPAGGLTKKTAKALFAYQGGGSDIMNAFARGKDISAEYVPSHLSGIKEVPKAVADLKAIIDKSALTKKTTVHRGFSDASGQFNDDSAIGKVIQADAFLSTSKDVEVAKQRGEIAWMRDNPQGEQNDDDYDAAAKAGAWTMAIQAPAGAKALDINDSLAASGMRESFANEQEVLFNPGIQVRIDGIDRATKTVTASVVQSPIARDDWKESDHPRGQPGNAGQFGSGGGGGGSYLSAVAQRSRKRGTK